MNIDETHTSEHTNNGVGRLNKIAYRDGYIHGIDVEPHPQPENTLIRNNISQHDKAARGLRLGIILTALFGLVGGTFFLLAQHYRQSITPVKTTPVPAHRYP